MSLACPECGRRNSEFDPRCLDCGTPLPTSTSPEPRPAPTLVGDRLDRFEILGELGRGGMGVVYRARDLELGREVALKLLAGDTDRRRVLREARAVAALDHPAIGTLYELGTVATGPAAGTSFLVLALYQGRTLAAELKERGRLPTTEAIAILHGLAGALGAAHAAGILHRDVKPSNVFRLADGRVKLIDFGIAQNTEKTTQDSASGSQSFFGSAAYMAPERLRQGTNGEAADIWALGVVGWEMLTGEHPFASAQPGWLERIFVSEPDPALLPLTEMPAGLEALLLACLARDAEKRPTAAHLEAALAALLTLLPTAPPATPSHQKSKLPVTAAALLLLAGLSSWAFWPKISRTRVVTVLDPHVVGALTAGDRERLAANLEATSWRTLLRLQGIETLDRNLARQNPGEPAAVARATAADETLGWEASCPGVDLCAVRLLRRDAAGRVLGSESLELSVADDALSARAATAALRRIYPELKPRDDRPWPEPNAATYQRYLELRSALDRRQITPEAALLKLAELGQDSKLPELAALEAGICRFLLARDRDETWLERGLLAVERGLALAPGDSVLLATRVDLLAEAGRLPAATAALEQLAGSGAGLGDVLLRQARLAEASGRPEEALRLLRRLTEDRPAAHFLLTLANLEQRLGQSAAARKNLELALEKAPHHAQARAQLATLDLVEGRLEAAAEGWRQLTENNPTLDALGNYGLVLMLQRRYAEAEPVFRQALARQDRHRETRLNLADTLTLLGRRDEAAVLYRQLMAEGPGDPAGDWRVRAMYAQACAHLGEREAARTALGEVLKEAPDHPEAALSAALVWMLLGDSEAALGEARRAVAAGGGRVWFELPFFDPLTAELQNAGIRQRRRRAKG